MTATCLIGVIILAGAILARRQRVTARVEIAAPIIEVASEKHSQKQTNVSLPEGEVARMASRVREVSALVMGLTLLAVNEAITQHPVRSAEELTERFITRGLLPPTIRPSNARAILESDSAVLYVRYRSEPLALEIISLGRETGDGAPIIGRIITGSEENAALFIARKTVNASLPAPFLPAARIVAMNWSAEPWRERTFTPQELEHLNQELRTANVKP